MRTHAWVHQLDHAVGDLIETCCCSLDSRAARIGGGSGQRLAPHRCGKDFIAFRGINPTSQDWTSGISISLVCLAGEHKDQHRFSFETVGSIAIATSRWPSDDRGRNMGRPKLFPEAPVTSTWAPCKWCVHYIRDIAVTAHGNPSTGLGSSLNPCTSRTRPQVRRRPRHLNLSYQTSAIQVSAVVQYPQLSFPHRCEQQRSTLLQACIPVS